MARISGFILMVLFIDGGKDPLSAPAMAMAIDTIDSFVLELGEQDFNSNCAARLVGGGNVIRANRKLKVSDLNDHVEAYTNSPLEALAHEIEDGLNETPGYADKLTEEEIIAVSTYVEQRAELSWSRQ